MTGEGYVGAPYSKAPIVEAVIEIVVTLPASVTLAVLSKLHDAISDAYPKQRDRLQVDGLFEGGVSVSARVQQQVVGYQFASDDDLQVTQACINRFSFSRLAPYQGWASFRSEAQRLWHLYEKATRPTEIHRVGVRFINRLDLPSSLQDFKEYLRTVPEIAPDLPQGLANYFMRLEIPYEEEQAMLVIQQALMPRERPDTVSIILDIDAIYQGDTSISDGHLWKIIETLREVKNDAFEKCITDRFREVIS